MCLMFIKVVYKCLCRQNPAKNRQTILNVYVGHVYICFVYWRTWKFMSTKSRVYWCTWKLMCKFVYTMLMVYLYDIYTVYLYLYIISFFITERLDLSFRIGSLSVSPFLINANLFSYCLMQYEDVFLIKTKNLF